MNEFIDAYSLGQNKLPCPLQKIYIKEGMPKKDFNEYYNKKCVNCPGNTPSDQKTPIHNMIDMAFMLGRVQEKIEEEQYIKSLDEFIDKFMKRLFDEE